MAARKTKKTLSKTHYVKSRKRKGAESAVVAQRTVVVVFILLLIVSVAAGVGMGFRWVGRKLFSENPRFEIQHLEIVCDGQQYSESKIREYCGISEGMNLFSVSFDEIENALKLPNVDSVHSERVLPNTLVITVKERVPVSRVMIKGSRLPRYLDRYGYVLSPSRDPALAGLPLIKGLPEDLRPGYRVVHRDIEALLEIIALCDTNRKLHTFVKIESLDVKYDDYIDMRLKGGSRVRMPRYRLQPKLQELATIIQMATEQGKRLKEADLTLDSPNVVVTYY